MTKLKSSGFTQWLNVVSEDIQPGYAPEEISFGGYTTKNLHHSADAAMAFQSTIEKVKRGEINDSTGVLHALKATDTYMGLNDIHLEQGKAPDETELKTWRDAHVEARFHLNKVGEFMHHMDYWHMHEHELQDMETEYTPETAGAEMADSYIPQNDLVESAAARFNQKVKQAQDAHEAGDHKRAKYHLDTARNFMLGINSNDHSKIKDSYPKYKELRDMHKEEVELDEEVKHPSEDQVSRDLKARYGEANYKSKATGSTHRVTHDGKHYRSGMMRSSSVSGLLNLIDKKVNNKTPATGTMRFEEFELDEAVKLGTKVKIHAPGRDYHGQVGHIGEIRHGAYKGAPKTYTVDYGDRKSIQLDKKDIKVHKEEVELDEESSDKIHDIASLQKHFHASVAYDAASHGPAMMQRKDNSGKVRQLVRLPNGKYRETDLNEALTDKTIKSGDKIKVARVIADMLGVENAETMSPEAAINAGLRKIKNKRMTPELVGVVKKMLTLAQEVGVKVDASLVPKTVNESEEVDKDDDYNIAKDILRFSDFQKLSKMNRGIEQKDPTEVGHSLHHDDQDQVRCMKVKYKTEDFDLEESFVVKDPVGKIVHTAYSQKTAEKKAEELSTDTKQKHTVHYDREAYVKEDMDSADYKINPETGRKYRAHKIEFDNSGANGKLDHDDEIKEEVEEFDFSEDDLEKMVGSVNTEDDIMHAYDDGELVLVDVETGEEINEESIINTEILSEVLSRIERMKAKIRFARTAPKRERRMQIALKRRSDTKTLNKRARRVAIALLKQRIMRKPAAQLTVSEKERVERMLASRKAVIDRLAMKLTPRVRKIETDRLSHSKATQS